MDIYNIYIYISLLDVISLFGGTGANENSGFPIILYTQVHHSHPCDPLCINRHI